MLYEAYGLSIDSEIEVPLLNKSNLSSDVVISVDNNLELPSEYEGSDLQKLRWIVFFISRRILVYSLLKKTLLKLSLIARNLILIF